MLSINKKITAVRKPKPTPEAALLFGKVFTDHMFTAEYEEGKGWYEASILPYGPIEMDPATMVFHYAQAAFEGLKCYRAVDGRLLLFRPDKNFQRLSDSSERLCIPRLDVDFALEALTELLKTDQDWVPNTEGTSLYIRPFVIATENSLGVHISQKYKFMIILSPVGSYYKSGLAPVKISIEDEYVRAVRGGTGHTKAAANYAISLKGQEKAEALGYAQVLWLDGVERKYVEEVGSMNVFFKIGGVLTTPDLTGSILPGVTRDAVMTLARSWGIPVRERRISVEELFAAHENGHLEEAFGTGTACVICPIGCLSWADREITLSGGQTGELSKKLYDELTGIQYARRPDPFGWMKEVPV
ncbi:MAG: branched-chain amino acid aminotransferase [Clostridiales bacterium]|jgi:branched-chain amino acid aminotransferase|nr:branched-chain amino acid aminotransferase [Clostridiales bacterium]